MNRGVRRNKRMNYMPVVTRIFLRLMDAPVRQSDEALATAIVRLADQRATEHQEAFEATHRAGKLPIRRWWTKARVEEE